MRIPDLASPHSDMRPEGLEFLRESFELAHLGARGGLSVEVGTRRGGSAFLQLLMLKTIYPDHERPMLFTVDPYGMKPYRGGDMSCGGLYGEGEYGAMKRLLAAFPNHAHWYLESMVFFAIAPELVYWAGGTARRVKDLAFVLLDGDHDQETIGSEVAAVLPLMHPKGVIVVDNFDKDPGTPQRLSRYTKAVRFGPTAPRGSLQLRIHVDLVS